MDIKKICTLSFIVVVWNFSIITVNAVYIKNNNKQVAYNKNKKVEANKEKKENDIIKKEDKTKSKMDIKREIYFSKKILEEEWFIKKKENREYLKNRIKYLKHLLKQFKNENNRKLTNKKWNKEWR